MYSDDLYKDPDLNLTSLSEKLGISSHQLSELVNKHKGKNFSRYVLEIRVDAAIKLLKTCPDHTILSIAYDVGFCSNAAFYNGVLPFFSSHNK